MFRRFRLLLLFLVFCLAAATAACQGGSSPGSGPGSSPTISNSQRQVRLLVHFIDVGQGDAILVQTPAGQNLLVDGGPMEAGPGLLAYLEKQGVKKIDVLVATHPHADHIGGLIQVINKLPVERIYMPRVTTTSGTFEQLLKSIKKRGLTIETARAGGDLALKGIGSRILWSGDGEQEDLNNCSVVLRVQYGQTSFLLTGDAGREVEDRLLSSGAGLKADVLKVGHHGSSSASGPAFLRAVQPRMAVIMCGKGNDYGHPHAATLKALEEAGAAVYRTDLQGTIVMASDGRQVTAAGVDKTVNGRNTISTTGEEKDEPYYIGNVKSRVFHRPDCNNLPADRNQIRLDSRSKALEAGYRPCPRCRP